VQEIKQAASVIKAQPKRSHSSLAAQETQVQESPFYGMPPEVKQAAKEPLGPAGKDPEVDRIAHFLAQGKCVLSDVRSTEEFASGSVPGALNIPLDNLPQRLSLLSSHCVESSGRVVVFCGGPGQQSKIAQKLLQNQGYNVVDGINVPYMLEALRTLEAQPSRSV